MSERTFSVVDRLPDGTERVVATGVKLSEVLEYSVPDWCWAVTFVEEKSDV